MRIISLEPYITELLLSFDLGASLVGVSHRCVLPKELEHVVRVTKARQGCSGEMYLEDDLSRDAIDLEAIKSSGADWVVASIYGKPISEKLKNETLLKLEAGLRQKLGNETKLISYAPVRLDDIYEGAHNLAKELKIPTKGPDIGQRAKAQLMDWGDNFYERMKNKKVTFLSGVQPLTYGGFWIPDMIQALSAVGQFPPPLFEHKPLRWQDVVAFRPDVIIVAPKGAALKESMATFKIFEKFESWQDIPAVKRGEVVFCDGQQHFFSPGLSIISSFGIMVSAIAGLESGYITPRDSFYRLRWLELRRHRL